LGVAEEVGVGRQDLEFLDGGYGADQEIDRRTLDPLTAALVAESGVNEDLHRLRASL
jgi:hypothetical protein